MRAARELATSLAKTYPSAAASIREGLQAMLTVRRLGLSEPGTDADRDEPGQKHDLDARTSQRNVKNWKDAALAGRWTTAGMLVAESKLRRVKGHQDMPLLVAARARHTSSGQPETGSHRLT